MATGDFALILTAVASVAFLLWLVSLATPKPKRYYPAIALQLLAIAGSSWIGKLVAGPIESTWMRWGVWLLVAAAVAITALWLEQRIRRLIRSRRNSADS
jgi:hypothetical protein